MRPVFAALVLLALSVPAHSAVVRYVYFDQNGRDLRIETIIDKWWADRVDEVAYVPAGTPHLQPDRHQHIGAHQLAAACGPDLQAADPLARQNRQTV